MVWPYKVFEKVLTVAYPMECLLCGFFMVLPDMADILSGMVPSIPDTPGTLGLIAPITGNNVSAAVLYEKTVGRKRRWGFNDLKKEKTRCFD